MESISFDKLPKELKKLKSIKAWYKASEYINWIYLHEDEKFFENVNEFYEWIKEKQNNKEVIWFYGSYKSMFEVPSVEDLFAEAIEEEIGEDAWSRVKDECKSQLLLIEQAFKNLEKAMEEKKIVRYDFNYNVGVIIDEYIKD